MICLIGSDGSMGKRYQAILNFNREEVECFDRVHLMGEILMSAVRADGVILATPTETHTTYLRELIPVNRKILCEKPVTKNMSELVDMYRLAEKHGTKLTMMMQYAELIDPSHVGLTTYDYFRTGPDRLPWDCMQAIGLAKGQCVINDKSPVWRCSINGKALSIADMDAAYVRFVAKWLMGEIKQDPDTIIQMHMKVRDFGKDAEIYESAS